MDKSYVVTGTSSGIGHAITALLIDKGARVFGSVRRQADAERLRAEFGAAFVPLIFDVTDEVAIHASAEQVRAALGGKRLAGLVNNAGIVVGGPVLDMALEAFQRQMSVNLAGPFLTVRAFLPLLGTEPALSGVAGRIVNIGSVAGRQAFPFMAPYHVTKYGLEGFTEAVRRELLPFGIDAILVAPGAVKTPIWHKARQEDHSRYRGGVYEKPLQRFAKLTEKMDANGVAPERIAQGVFKALSVAKPKPYYRISNTEWRYRILQGLPKRVADRLVGHYLGLKKT